MLAQKTRYALRSLLYLAELRGGPPVQLASIASTQQVPPKYLELIMPAEITQTPATEFVQAFLK